MWRWLDGLTRFSFPLLKDCVCDFHWCNEWSLNALMYHFDDHTTQLFGQGVYTRPPLATSTAITSTSTKTATTTTTTITNTAQQTMPLITMMELVTDNDTGSSANLSADAFDVASAATESAPHPIYLLASSSLAVLALLHAV
ncbi:hypothetical protein RvY_18024 [Ramazzottius varieornatus]|uniref:Uncharacterized protein n=1 Tax=Ramazzottius varieornatus TaxID=947166 RepID=A0A1D1W4E0_RAMVA|nr:hypothetical protein RvY_18024 [Ramazzottius varieornatus]